MSYPEVVFVVDLLQDLTLLRYDAHAARYDAVGRLSGLRILLGNNLSSHRFHVGEKHTEFEVEIVGVELAKYVD